jgi:hypothetical protein
MGELTHALDQSVNHFTALPLDNNSSSEGVNSGKVLSNKGFTALQQQQIIKTFRLTDTKYHGKPAVRIPYLDESGNETAVRYRTALIAKEGSRWKTGSKTSLYGLHLMDKIREAGYVLLVEGESDTWTGWLHDIPTLGVPGKSNWKSEWAPKLEGLDLYVWQEPDAEDFTHRIYKDLPHIKVIPAPDGIKDINELLQKGEDVKAIVSELLKGAVAVTAIMQQELSEKARRARKAATEVLECDDPLILIREAIEGQGYGGDIKKPLIVYLAATSRVLAMRTGAMPVHLLLRGLPSAGKSYTLKLVLNLLPPEAYHIIDAGSPRALIYDGADLKHRLVVFSEADSLPAGEDNPAASAIRNLLQDGHLHYTVTVRNPETGEFIAKEISKPGPTTMVTTSTKRLGQQLESRMFLLDIPDSDRQIKSALLAQAGLELSQPADIDSALIAFQEYLQLSAPWHVVVPCARAIAEAISKAPGLNSRITRDYARLIALIKAVALLNMGRRKTDDRGRIIATVEDYQMVYSLVGDMYTASLTGASQAIRETVQAVTFLKETGERKVTVADVAKELGLSKPAAKARVSKAIAGGWLVNEETRKGHPADLRPGDPLPPEEILPEPSKLCGICGKPVKCGFTGTLPQNNATDLQEHGNGKAVNHLAGSNNDTLFENTLKSLDGVYKIEDDHLLKIKNSGNSQEDKPSSFEFLTEFEYDLDDVEGVEGLPF